MGKERGKTERFTENEQPGTADIIKELNSRGINVSFGNMGDVPYSEGFDGFEGFEEGYREKLPHFSTELLPPNFREFSEDVTESLQVDTGMVAPAVTTATAAGIQQKYCVHPHTDWYEPGNLYMAIVAEPSERKSPTMKEIVKPIHDYETEENERRKPAIALYESKKKILEGQISNATKNASKTCKKKGNEKVLDLGDLTTLQQELNELEEITPLRLIVDDITIEVLAKLMQQNNECISIMSTEGGVFNMLAGRYSDNTVIDLVLKSFSGDKFTVDRVGRKGQTLKHPLITILLYTQPIVIQQIMENSEFVERGLNARFFYSFPQSTIGRRRYKVRKINEDARERFYDAIQRLYAIPVPEKPKPIELDEDADRLAEAYFYEIEKEMENVSPEFQAWLGKLHGTTMRLALILHCMEYIEESEFHKISEKTMRNAIEMGKYYRAHAEAAFGIMGLMDPPEVRDAKYILRRIDSTGLMEMKLRDLYQLCKDKKGMETKEGMIPGLKCLIAHGYIRIQKVVVTQNPQNPQNPQKGGRPSEMVYVNPEYIKWKEQKG